MAAKKVGLFVTGTMNSHFFVTEQIGMKLAEFKRQSVLILIEEFSKLSLKRVILSPNRQFWVALTGLRVTGLYKSGVTFLNLANPSIN